MRYARLVATTLLGMLLCAFPASYFTGAVVRAARARKSLTRNQAIVLPQLAVLTPFFPQLAAPNPAPKTEVYRTCTEHFMGSIRKAEFSQARYSEPPSTAPTSLGPFGPVGGFRLAMAADSCPRLNLWLANCYFAHASPPCWHSGMSGPTSERESLPTTLHEGTARHTYFPVLFKSPLFYYGAPGRDSNSRPSGS